MKKILAFINVSIVFFILFAVACLSCGGCEPLKHPIVSTNYDETKMIVCNKGDYKSCLAMAKQLCDNNYIMIDKIERERTTTILIKCSNKKLIYAKRSTSKNF